MKVKRGVTYRKLKELVEKWRNDADNSWYDSASNALILCADELEALYQEDDPGLEEMLKEAKP
jgi:hypothetical protein